MKIPKLFYGTAKEVSGRVRRLTKELVKRRDFGLYDPGPMLDTDEVDGEILLQEPFMEDAPFALGPPPKHFHCYLVPEGVLDAVSPPEKRPVLREWLLASLDEPWRLMCTLSGSVWLAMDGQPTVSRRYLEAAIQHWTTVSEVRHRFGPKIEPDDDILRMWTTLFYAVEALGVSMQQRRAVSGRHPSELLDLVNRAYPGSMDN